MEISGGSKRRYWIYFGIDTFFNYSQYVVQAGYGQWREYKKEMLIERTNRRISPVNKLVNGDKEEVAGDEPCSLEHASDPWKRVAQCERQYRAGQPQPRPI